jgi:hypothetical protein
MVDAPGISLVGTAVTLDVAAIVADPKSICVPTAVNPDVADIVATPLSICLPLQKILLLWLMHQDLSYDQLK